MYSSSLQQLVQNTPPQNRQCVRPLIVMSKKLPSKLHLHSGHCATSWSSTHRLESRRAIALAPEAIVPLCAIRYFGLVPQPKHSLCTPQPAEVNTKSVNYNRNFDIIFAEIKSVSSRWSVRNDTDSDSGAVRFVYMYCMWQGLKPCKSSILCSHHY